MPNAFVFAFEEFNNGTDHQDFVGIIRNVKPRRRAAARRSGSRTSTARRSSDHLVFNRIQDPVTNGPVPTTSSTTWRVLRIRNTGTGDADISSISASARVDRSTGSSTPRPPSTPAGFVDLNGPLRRQPGRESSARCSPGTLTINSNDADEPVSTISLGGYWQPRNEDNKEPTLQQMFSIFGYKTWSRIRGRRSAEAS